jgi:hypothetical protein
MGPLKKYSYLWVTAILFFGSLLGHWTLAWYHYVGEQKMHGQPIEVSNYIIETATSAGLAGGRLGALFLRRFPTIKRGR